MCTTLTVLQPYRRLCNSMQGLNSEDHVLQHNAPENHQAYTWPVHLYCYTNRHCFLLQSYMCDPAYLIIDTHSIEMTDGNSSSAWSCWLEWCS